MLISAEWYGPLPPPGILDAFDHVVPGGAERIFKQFEEEAHHRRARERRADNTVRLGQILAGLFAAGMLLLSAYAFHEQANWAGTLIGGGAITTGILAFLGVDLRRKK